MENSQLPKLKVFQLIQKNFASVGIVSNLAIQPYPMNKKIAYDFLILVLAFFCNFTYAFCEAKTFIEYIQSIFMISITIIVNFSLLTLIFNVEKLFGIINGCENIVNTSQ